MSAITNVASSIDYTNILNDILTQLQAVNANTDQLEADITQLIADVQAGNVTLTAINTSLGDILTEAQAINANTDGIEALITATNNLLQTEFDEQQLQFASMITELQAVNTKLNETCAGAPINVTVCNPVDVSGLQTSLDNILTELQAVNANTDTLEASFAQVISDIQAGNVDLAAIEVLLTTANASLAAIDANTDTVEALITALTNTVTAEGDQTQTLLGDIETTLTNLETVLQAACGSGNEQNVNVCNPTDVSGLLTELQAINANTDGLENLFAINNNELIDINTELDAQTTSLGTINTSVLANTATLEATLTNLETVLQAACGSGNEQNVNICNTVTVDTGLDLTTLETNTGNTATNTAATTTAVNSVNTTLGTTNTELANINTELDNIEADTTAILADTNAMVTDLAAIETALGDVNTELDTQTTALNDINTELDTQTTELQDINTELDNVEVTLTNIETVVQAACGSGDEQNVVVCPNTAVTVTSTDLIATADTTIPAGFRHAAIAIRSGVAVINGATYNAGESLALPPMSYGATDVLYPAYPVTGITGEVIINYHV